MCPIETHSHDILWNIIAALFLSKPKRFARILLFHFIVWFESGFDSFDSLFDNMHVEEVGMYCHFTFNIHMNFTASQSHRACVPLTLLFQSDFSIQNHFSRKVFLMRVSFGEVFFSRICSSSLLPVLNMILQMFLTVRQDWDFFYLKCIE